MFVTSLRFFLASLMRSSEKLEILRRRSARIISNPWQLVHGMSYSAHRPPTSWKQLSLLEFAAIADVYGVSQPASMAPSALSSR